ncbi:hypothetical protein BH09ACT7_BH09ACT7_44870 [soil metagenome]
MDLIWWAVMIAGLVGLAICIGAVLLRPMDIERRLRLLANVGRLTRLPEYRRAARLRTLSAVVAIILLLVIFSAAVIVAARPTGWPSAARESAAVQPEDIMLCVGGPPNDPVSAGMLRYFAQRAPTFGTERIGLTAANRRMVPLTRDYQYAAGQFNEYAALAERQGDAVSWGPAVTYADYAGSVEDTLAMCLTGFPSFDQVTPQRRSLVYVGPGSLRKPDETRPALYTADEVRDLAVTAGVQVNAVFIGPGGGALDALAGDTGGRSFSGDPAMITAQLSEIRAHPPTATAAEDEAAVTQSVESPDIPIIVALAALAALVLWPLVVRI